MIALRAAAAGVCLCLGSCSPVNPPSADDPSAPATARAGSTDARPSSPPATDVATGQPGLEGAFDVGGFSLWLECTGSGSPTVVFEAGLGSGREAWAGIALRVALATRSCTYDRAGIGRSEPRPAAETTPGAMADEFARLLVAAGVDGPIVLVGHSYGGWVVQLAADRQPETVAGVVLVDSSSGRQFEEAFPVTDHVWTDGTTVVDQSASVTELAAVDLGAIPLVVPTQDGLDGDLGADWARYQAELAALSTNALHLVATGAGHGIQDDAPDLVRQAISATVDAVRAGSALPPCAEFAGVGGECFPG